MKVILNKRYGGFRPSASAYRLYGEKMGVPVYAYEMELVGGNGRWYRRSDKEDDGFGQEFFTKDFGERVMEHDDFWDYHIALDEGSREDPVLIEVVEELGEKASSKVSRLVVVNIPDGLDYVVDEYDGYETLHERVRVW